MRQQVFLRVTVGALASLIMAFSFPGNGAAQDDQEGRTDATIVDLVTTDFTYSPSSATVNAGAVRFNITNQGKVEHDLAIEDSRRQIQGKSEVFAAGGSGILDVTLMPGTYTMVCTIPSHREAGMLGTLTVNP